MTSPDLFSAISSPGSESGPTPFASPDGPTTARSGPDRAHASLSARQAKERGLLTSGTCGPHGSGSLTSAGLTSCLASRFRARTASAGSTLYRLTWKERVTPSGRSIPALRASALRTSGKGSITVRPGWSTPKASEAGPDFAVSNRPNTGGYSLQNAGPIFGLADSDSDGRCEAGRDQPEGRDDGTFGNGTSRWLVNGIGQRLEGHSGNGGDGHEPGRVGAVAARSTATAGRAGRMEHDAGDGRVERRPEPGWRCASTGCGVGGLADNNDAQRRADGAGGHVSDGARTRRTEISDHARSGRAASNWSAPGPTNGFWRDADWLRCRDDRWRPVEPGTFPLAHGAAARVGRLRGYGNGLVAPHAATFIEAFDAVTAAQPAE